MKSSVITILLIVITISANSQITTSEVNVKETNNVTTISGTVGIGTSNPLSTLDVDGTVTIFDRVNGYGILTINSLDNNKYSYINFGPGTGYGFQVGKDIDNGGVAGANNFYIYDLLNNAPRFVIDDVSGNIGIGTTNPQWGKLQVDANSDQDNALRLQVGRFSMGGNAQFGIDAPGIGGGRLIMTQGGNLGIGTPNPTEKLHVNGKIRATGQVGWADFVFEDEYLLPELEQVEKDIDRIGHLPGIPSTEEVRANGIDLTEMDSKLLQKIEELTLYLIEQNKELQKLKEEVSQLKINSKSR